MVMSADPGKIHRGRVEMYAFNLLSVMLALSYYRAISTSAGTVPDTPEWKSDLEVHATAASATPTTVETKRSGARRFCKWCSKYKPDRCHHCRVCKACVLRMDHHCPWINNCVGFGNYKFFFLVIFYALISVATVTIAMIESVQEAIEVDTPFWRMFVLLFGETLAGFLMLLLSAFFTFHVWILSKAMTTIEFCEKSGKEGQYRSDFDLGTIGNATASLGPNVLLWLVPILDLSGDGLSFVLERKGLLNASEVQERRSSKSSKSTA